MFLQRFMATPIDVEIFQSVTRLLHCSNLYELLEQDGSFHQVFTEAQLGHHPVLDLIEATHKPLQVSRDDTWKLMPAEYVVDELHLERWGQWVKKKPENRWQVKYAKRAGSLVLENKMIWWMRQSQTIFIKEIPSPLLKWRNIWISVSALALLERRLGAEPRRGIWSVNFLVGMNQLINRG